MSASDDYTDYLFNQGDENYKQFWINILKFVDMTPQWYITMVTSLFCMSTNKLVQNISVWYGVTIAILRALILKYPLNPRIVCFIETKYGIRPLFFVTLLFLPFWLISYFQNCVTQLSVWTPSSECTNHPVNYTQTEYYYASITVFGHTDIELYKTSLILEGFTCKILPCILLPIATVLLIWELKKSHLTSETASSSAKSTKLVIVMTISFFVANFPVGLMYLIEFLVFDSPGLVYILKLLTSAFGIFNNLNATIHFVICFSMSAQYRQVAKEILGLGKSMISAGNSEIRAIRTTELVRREN